MDSNLQRRIQRYGWDKAAPYYERSWQVQLEPAQSALLDLVDLKPGDRVLDVACGSGRVTFRAAAKIAPGQVVGVRTSVLGCTELHQNELSSNFSCSASMRSNWTSEHPRAAAAARAAKIIRSDRSMSALSCASSK